MRTKDLSVQTSFHPVLTQFLFIADQAYREWNDELIITSGSEHSARHSKKSLHYATPAQAADIRIWDKEFHNRGNVPSKSYQVSELKRLAKEFCKFLGIPSEWVEVILESDHIHIEYQPKRIF